MRFAVAVLIVAAVVACTAKEEATPDSAAAAASPAAPTVASFAGTWNTAAVLEGAPVPVTGPDSRVPVVMALAAAKSLQEHRPVRIEEVASREVCSA